MCTVHWNYTHVCSGPGRLWSRDPPAGVGRGLFRVLLLCDALIRPYREVAGSLRTSQLKRLVPQMLSKTANP